MFAAMWKIKVHNLAVILSLIGIEFFHWDDPALSSNGTST